jgi:hypothetical protein
MVDRLVLPLCADRGWQHRGRNVSKDEHVVGGELLCLKGNPEQRKGGRGAPEPLQ